MAKRIKGTRLHVIQEFWDWFAANRKKLELLYKDRSLEELALQLTREIDKIEPQLAWELGPGKREANLLTISAEGNRDLRKIADLVVQMAPPLKGWEFHSSKPPRPAPEVVRLPESGETFVTTHWEFVPLERYRIGRLDLIIVDDSLAQANREPAIKAVSIYLDEMLGEDTVEKWIGKFEVSNRSTVAGKTKYKMTELPDYLEWATNRSKSPLTRTDI